MTLILAIERPEQPALVCYDAGMWQGEAKTTLRTPKVWSSNGWVIGAAGNWGACQALRNMPAPEMPTDATFDEATKVAFGFSRRLLEEYADIADVLKRTDDMKPESPQVVAAWGTWVWELTNGEATSSSRGFECVGIGTYAVGAWAALDSYGCGELLNRAWHVFRAIESVSHYIAPPYRWMATDGTEGEL